MNQRLYVLSHSAPNVTVIDTKDGSVVGPLTWRRSGTSRHRQFRSSLRGY